MGWGGGSVLAGTAMAQPEEPGAPLARRSCLGPWWSAVYVMCSGRPGAPRCACPLRGRSGSMCVEAHYLATDAAAGRAERKKEDIPWISKKRFIEVNCTSNIPRSTIGDERATKRLSKLTEVELKFCSEWIGGSLLFGLVERSQVFLHLSVTIKKLMGC